jgi:hypothetical protein
MLQLRTASCKVHDVPIWLVKVRPPRGNTHAPEQRNTIYRLVQAYGETRAARRRDTEALTLT